MELYEEILRSLDAERIVALACYDALRRIRSILTDERLRDPECFQQIEEIVNVFESLGSDGGGRHDFG